MIKMYCIDYRCSEEGAQRLMTKNWHASSALDRRSSHRLWVARGDQYDSDAFRAQVSKNRAASASTLKARRPSGTRAQLGVSAKKFNVDDPVIAQKIHDEFSGVIGQPLYFACKL
jgi:hypothetical protein